MSEESNSGNIYEPESPQETSTKKERKYTSGKIVALALCFSLLGGILGAAVTFYTMRFLEDYFPNLAYNTAIIQKADRDHTDVDIKEVHSGDALTPAQVYAKNVNSTVGITTAVTTNYWGYQTTSAASGSGFILTKDGYILTNYHVIEDSSSISVSMYNGASYDARLVGYDAANDIAILKIDAQNLIPVVIGESENMNVGDTVVAIGNPLGELTFSLTKGVISAKDRQVTFSGGSTMKLFQTDCTINSGNSGGALFNLYGEVIGITNAKYSNNGSAGQASIESIGFAIPIDNAMEIAESIIEKGYVSKPYIGVSVTDVSKETQSYGLPEGAAVKSVAADSPSQKAGLQVNDIILSANSEKISGSSDLIAIVSDMDVGDILELTVYRRGQTVAITIEVGEQIQQAIQQTK